MSGIDPVWWRDVPRVVLGALLVCSAASCQSDDQGSGQALCGNGVCELGEGPAICPADCGGGATTAQPTCGDGVCNGAESCSTCGIDCGACAPACGDGACNGSETCGNCPSDCGACAPVCGDAICNGSETCSNCAEDCGTCAPVCGDGACKGSETCSSCKHDCGACAPTCTDTCKANTCASGTAIEKCTLGSNGCKAPGAVVPCGGGEVCSAAYFGGPVEYGPCVDHDECGGKEVFASGSCTNASGLTYVVTLVSGQVPVVDDKGINWDPGGLPELKACLEINDEVVGCTGYTSDSVTANWDKSFETKIYASDTVSVSYYDVDVVSNDYIAGILWKDTVSLLKNKGYSGEWSFKPGYHLKMVIAPK